jgi:hypothetical protein
MTPVEVAEETVEEEVWEVVEEVAGQGEGVPVLQPERALRQTFRMHRCSGNSTPSSMSPSFQSGMARTS